MCDCGYGDESCVSTQDSQIIQHRSQLMCLLRMFGLRYIISKVLEYVNAEGKLGGELSDG
jgi:hypothetical protein